VGPRYPDVGDVVQLELSEGVYAYGRVLRDASVAFYRQASSEPRRPPIGNRDFQFVVGVYADVVASLEVVGHDASDSDDDDWPPPSSVTDKIGGGVQLYYRGELRPATEEECRWLEPAAVWDLPHLIERLTASRR
jgi:hypothetical protein